jgi:hypothetical protein
MAEAVEADAIQVQMERKAEAVAEQVLGIFLELIIWAQEEIALLDHLHIMEMTGAIHIQIAQQTTSQHYVRELEEEVLEEQEQYTTDLQQEVLEHLYL